MEVEENKPKNGINKTAVLGVALVALILGLSIVGYGYMNISYKNKVFEAEQAEKSRERLAEETEKEKQEEEKKLNKLLLETCLSNTTKNYSEVWNGACKERGLPEECELPGPTAEYVDKSHETQRDECFKKYPVE